MIKFDFLVCSESVLRDAEKDSFSAINILEDVVAETYPTFIPKLAVLLNASREDADPKVYSLVFTITNNEELIFSQQIPINFQNKQKANLALNIGSFSIKSPGKLTFSFGFQQL